MPKSTRVATCCYCGTRATLVLKGKDRHELSCSSCGAPLHNLKKLRSDRPVFDSPVKPAHGHMARPTAKMQVKSKKVEKRQKKRKGLWARVLDEAVDAIEDIFD